MTLAQPPMSAIPLLENGDRLTRKEFEQRYHAMPHCKKAELIEGQVYLASPRPRPQTQPTSRRCHDLAGDLLAGNSRH